MATDFAIRNLRVALLERLHPAIGGFNRLEGRPRTEEFGPALRADVRDGVWFLTRQWQMGEFRAEDAGSAVKLRYHAERSPVLTYQAGANVPQSFDASVPLEALVEQRRIPIGVGPGQPLSLDIRLAAGRRLLSQIRILDPTQVTGFLSAWPAAAALPGAAGAGINAHTDTMRYVSAVAGHALDGWAVAEAFRANPAAALAAAGVAPADPFNIGAAVTRWLTWLDGTVLQPTPKTDAWVTERLEYNFGLSTGTGANDTLTGEGYAGGRLDWYAVDIAPKPVGETASEPEIIARTVLPSPAGFPGMPNARWWSFEDGRIDVGAMSVSTTDLGRLLLTEFALVYSNDWLVQPLPVSNDGLVEVKGVVVTDSFGRTFWLDAAGRGADDDWQRWSMFSLSKRNAAGAADNRVLLPPTAQHVQEGPMLEEVALVRDELANLVWGIETRVPLATGRSAPGGEVAEDTRAYFERLALTTPQSPPAEPVAPIRYRVMSDVPENWIPFVAAHTPGSNRDVRLQRAVLPRLVDGGPLPPELVRPRTSTLRGVEGDPFFLNEEEVPRSGARVTVRYQRTRWYDGAVVVWLGVGVETGRGEASSALRFDQPDAIGAPNP
jgi:hypothetical protein